MIVKTLCKLKSVKVIMAIEINSYENKQCKFFDEGRFDLPRMRSLSYVLGRYYYSF